MAKVTPAGRYVPLCAEVSLERAAYLQRLWAALAKRETLLVLGLTLLGLLAHAPNMLHYPAFTLKDDEGIYAAQAWAVLREGRLAPYTYWYDHAPGGWLLIAGWMAITGGPATFAGAINSGRVLMLVLHVAMVPLLYRIARRFGCGAPAAAFATVLFSLSPLALFYQRMLLLDNIMVFWLLLCLDLLLDRRVRLTRLMLSGVCCGMALLTKETAVFILPALLLIVVQQRRWFHGAFAIGSWLLPAAILVSWYPLYASLKGELFPPGLAINLGLVTLHTGADHVSLLGALQWQATRDGGGMFNFGNFFWQFMRNTWVPRDAVLILGGALAVAANMLRGVRDARALAVGALGLLPLYYLGRGGIVFEYYIVFAVPFLCLNIALLLALVLARLPTRASGGIVVLLSVLLCGSYWRQGTLTPLYHDQPDRAGHAAVTWMKQHLAPESRIIGRDDLWADLHEPEIGGPAFPNYHTHWKVAGDPEIRDGVFCNDWHTVDYLVMSPGLADDFVRSNDLVALNALRHAHPIHQWQADGYEIVLWRVDRSAGETGSTATRHSTFYYQAQPDRNAELEQHLRELAQDHPRYGYRRITARVPGLGTSGAARQQETYSPLVEAQPPAIRQTSTQAPAPVRA